MTDRSAILLWIRRDLRLGDHAALHAAAQTGRPVIPVFVRDASVDAVGAAPKWRLGLGLKHHAAALAAIGSRLVLRSGNARDALEALIDETGAGAVWWQRAYDPDGISRDTDVKSALRARGIDAQSFAGHLLFEPWSVETKTGGFYKVFTPMWKMVRDRDVAPPLPAPQQLCPPDLWPQGANLSDWRLGDAMHRGAAVVRRFVRLGEQAAHARLQDFMAHKVADYDRTRDLPAVDGTSGLSENLSLGEISPRHCWHAGLRARAEGKAGADTFLKELVWREFAYHLMWHTPRILSDNWKPDWDAFPWNTNDLHPEVIAWQQGRTGIPFVDAAMRELYVTGRMHNRGRMIVASYLTKHLQTHWKIGQSWFAATLIDWDPASNAMGWQWSAGSGPDATPYFRVFNPVTQRDKFDRDGAYVGRWIAEGQKIQSPESLSYFEAIPRSWGLTADDQYPDPVVDSAQGRQRALDAYQNRGF
ncbi:deoxyribodipyrimidine photo-lyase [Puniceibacterium sp. IMCC21224]|uniref:cryptochrome/photolyase family protein n=1 Tax=Puniceibacterium sp. IMCC21224 TaxID=1618204 RepID=UPI00064E0F11|nr:deoxyribodipyrimidine photo-lyase [Puniceibacterium sp. IMCC21224]KMK67542.1 deoxyribodipyrimidine photolyase [Puniceibacterium sp. IMCC21224]